jgi:hypothetical protein
MPEWRADSWVLALADDRLLKFFQGVVASAAGSQPGGDARADS